MDFHKLNLIWKLLLYGSTFFCSSLSANTSDVCVFIDYFGKEADINKVECSQHKICQKTFRIANIRIPPYNLAAQEADKKDIPDILKRCCGNSVRYDELYNFKNISEVNPKLLANANFVYPFLASAQTTSLYGFYFLPLEDPAAAVYVTKKNYDIKLWKSIFKLYPVIIVSLLAAVISGFVCWVIETWDNKEEFPRGFLIGWFDGFWWAFISMTTVGYGDKCPKSLLSKIYSIAWILVGIIACGIISGEITGQVINSNTPLPETMKEKKVGALQFRNYDMYVISQKGGTVVQNGPSNAIDFDQDVTQMIYKLKNDEIDGFVLDRQTLMHFTDRLMFNREENENEAINAMVKFFFEETLRTETKYDGKRFTYGVLIRDRADYEYFKDYIHTRNEHNTLLYAMDWSDFLNDAKSDNFALYSPDYELLFSPKEYFKRSMYVICSIIVFILLFGLVYEMRWRQKSRKKVAF